MRPVQRFVQNWAQNLSFNAGLPLSRLPPMTVRRHVWVSGRVQGVWFRDSCAREAAAVGVAGWVRNLTDGRVEAYFEGTEAAVSRMVEWCRQGPPRADVTGVEVEPGSDADGPMSAGFDVR